MHLVNQFKKHILGTKFPVIQAPMAGGILKPEFIAAVSNAGLLGFIAGGYLTPSALDELILTTKSMLQPGAQFGVNIFIEANPRVNETIVTKPADILKLEKLLAIKSDEGMVIPPTIAEDEYIHIIIKNLVPIVSCTFGFFNPRSVAKLKAHGIKIIGNASSFDEFNYCVARGADAVVLQGTEAGGHQASFLTNQANITSTIALLEEVMSTHPQLPVIAAGGIAPHEISAYLQHGAAYVQLGTAFMLTQQSNLPLTVKQFIIKQQTTRLTDVITGKWARGVSNKLSEALHNDGSYGFPIRHYLTATIRNHAKQLIDPEYLSLWAGSNPHNLRLLELAQLIAEIKSIVRA
jgi:nitronate monooxygenase